MKHCDRTLSVCRAFLAILFFLVSISNALGGNSKVTGRVTARQTGESLPGVNVVITHTIQSGGREVPLDRPYGAATDPNGYYFILNVPPGVYVMKASLVGYAPETQKMVRVESDRTITTDFGLVSSDVQLEGVEITATRELVRPDVSTTQEVITTTRLEQMPVVRMDEFVRTLKGVTLVSSADGNGLSVRGGAIRETDVRLDGISLQDPRTDNSYLALNTTTVQEVQVLTGGFEAKYGGIRSGLLNVVTKEGQRDRFSGSFKVDVAPAGQPRFFGTSPWSTDSWIYQIFAGKYAMNGVPAGDSTVPSEPMFQQWKGWATNRTQAAGRMTSQQKIDLWLKQHPQFRVAPKPDYYFEGSINGPVPGEGIPLLGEFAGRTTFLLGFKYENSQVAFPVGPRDNYLDWNGQLKLTSALSDNMRLTLNGMYAKVQSSSAGLTTSYGGALIDQSSSFGFLNSTRASTTQQARLIGGASFNQIFNKSRLQLYDNRYILGGAKLTHTLSNTAYYTIDFQMGYTDQLLSPFAMDTSLASSYATYTDSFGRSYRFFVPDYGSPNASTNYGADLLNTFYMYGGPQRVDSSYSYVYQLKGDFTAQLGRHHQVEAGFSARYQNMFVYTGTWFQAEKSFTPDTWQYFRNTPLEAGLYAQDKLEFEGMVLNAGLRLDYFNPMKKGYSTSYPLSEDYMKLYNETYNNLPGTPSGPLAFERWLAFRSLLDSPPGWPEASNKVQLYLSPRLGVSFPITESSKLYFNYGHFYQRPATSFLYDTQLYPGSVGVPTPDLDMARTVSYEFGYEQMIFSELLLNITAYYKDVRGEPLSTTFYNYYHDVIVSKYFPDRYNDVRGVEVRLERPLGRFFTFSGMYDYMLQSSGQSGLGRVFENRLEAKNAETRSPNIAVTEPRPRANFNLNLHTPQDFGPEFLGHQWLGGWYANFFFEWQDGGRLLLNGDEPDVKLWKYADIVNTWNIDFRASKTFATSVGSLELVLTIQNLTNNKWLSPGNMTQTQYDAYKKSLLTPDKGGDDKWGQYGGHINTGWYEAPIFLNPRRVLFGARINF